MWKSAAAWDGKHLEYSCCLTHVFLLVQSHQRRCELKWSSAFTKIWDHAEQFKSVTKTTSFLHSRVSYLAADRSSQLDAESPSQACPCPSPHSFVIPITCRCHAVITMVISVDSARFTALTPPSCVAGLHIGWPCLQWWWMLWLTDTGWQMSCDSWGTQRHALI